MPKLLIAFASATLLLASSGIWKANAATITNAGSLAPQTKSYTPVEKVYSDNDDTIAGAIYGRRYYGYGYRPKLRLRLSAIRLLWLRLETRHQHRYRTRLGLALLKQFYEAQLTKASA